MDPVSIIGLTTTAFGVVDRLAKTLNFLLQLSTKFRYVDAKISLLIGYLGSLNAAVYEIAGIVKGLSGRIQYQKLAETIDSTLECTKYSLSFLEMKLDGLHQDDDRTVIDKISVILKSAEFEDYINGISRYVNALNLLLAALQSRSLLEQQGILNNPEAESIMVAMEDETSSLVCIADSRSMHSKATKASETSTGVDISFDFDAEILGSKIYAIAYRSHLRQAISLGKRGQSVPQPEAQESEESIEDSASTNTVTPNSQPAVEISAEYPRKVQDVPVNDILVTRHFQIAFEDRKEDFHNRRLIPPANTGQSLLYNKAETGSRSTRRSSLLERLPRRNRRESTSRGDVIMPTGNKIQGTPEVKILLLGASESGKSTLLKGMKLFLEGPYTKADREDHSGLILSNLCQGVRTVLEAMETLELPLEDQRKEYHVQTIFMQPSELGPPCLPLEVATAVTELAGDEGFRACLQRRAEFHFFDNIDYYMKSTARMAAEYYVPSNTDVLHCQSKTTGITETTFIGNKGLHGESMTYRVFDVGGARSERKKWVHCFESVSVIFFTVDIGSYDQFLYEDETANRMKEALTLFDSIVNSKRFISTSIIICFTKHAKLAAKLEAFPFQNYFPDFHPGSPPDLNRTTDYIINRFQSLNKEPTKKIRTMMMSDLPTNQDMKALERLMWDAHEDIPEALRSRSHAL